MGSYILEVLSNLYQTSNWISKWMVWKIKDQKDYQMNTLLES